MYYANEAKKTSNIVFNRNFDKYIEQLLEDIKYNANRGLGKLQYDHLTGEDYSIINWSSFSHDNRRLIAKSLEKLGFGTCDTYNNLVISW